MDQCNCGRNLISKSECQIGLCANCGGGKGYWEVPEPKVSVVPVVIDEETEKD